jgi:3-phenylpropionate/trans-cinnamate dioxygenase ferredoxin subunit
MDEAALVDAGPADVGPGQCVWREVAGTPLLLARDAAGRLFALAGTCSHALLSLEGARLRGQALMCPHHGARFDLATGRPLGPPASESIPTFPVTEDGGRILVRLG